VIDELDRVFAVVIAALVAIEYGAFVIAEVRGSLRIERRCKQLAEEAHELGIEEIKED
jgi:hypothetical protein